MQYFVIVMSMNAPSEGSRVWIKFHVLEIGSFSGRQVQPCRGEYVRIAASNDTPAVTLCGSFNLTRQPLQFLSNGNVINLQLISHNGKQGRGFHASYRFGKSIDAMRVNSMIR